MKKRVYIYAIIGFIIDVASKLFITSKLDLGQSKNMIKGFFDLTLVHNTGGAWGLFDDNTLLLIIIGIIFTVVFIYMIEKNKANKIEELSYGLILSGVVGNLLDRIINGYVIDFLNFNIFGYDYPVFNFADTFIVGGVILLGICYLREEYKKWKKD